MNRRIPGAASVFGLALALAPGPPAPASAPRASAVASTSPALVPPLEAQRLLRRAFANQYELDLTATIELIVRDRSGEERRRRFHAASKIIGGRMHSIGRLVHPQHLRGMTILQVEAVDRGNDAFLYLPSLQAVRRISTAQRDDAFFGTDVTYEDLERRRTSDYEVFAWRAGVQRGSSRAERSFEIRARPRRPRSYHEVHFYVAESDHLILAADYFKRDAPEPYRTIEASRDGVQRASGHVLPTRLVVHNRIRGTTTEVTYLDLEIDPEIDDRVFSIRALEQRRHIPGRRRSSRPARPISDMDRCVVEPATRCHALAR